VGRPPKVEGSSSGLAEQKVRKTKAEHNAQRLKEEQEKLAKEKAAKEKGKKGAVVATKIPDPDPAGEALLKLDPLVEASKFLQPLLQYAPNNLTTQLLAFDVYFRRKKYVLCLKALNKAIAIAPQDPAVHKNKIRLFHAVETTPDLDKRAQDLFKSERDQLLGTKSLSEYNAHYAQGDASFGRALAAAEVTVLLDKSQAQAALATFVDKAPSSLEEAVAAHDAIKTAFQNEEAAQKFKEKAHALFPRASYFAPPKPAQTEPAPETPHVDQ